MARIFYDSEDDQCYLKTVFVGDGVEFVSADLDTVALIKLDFHETKKLVDSLTFILDRVSDTITRDNDN